MSVICLDAMKNIKQKIRETLADARISKSYKGYPFLEYSIYLVIEDDRRLCHIFNDVYGTVAKQFDTTPHVVEKNIRTIRDTFWQNNGFDFFRDKCGVTFYERPYPRELIEILADHVEKELDIRH